MAAKQILIVEDELNEHRVVISRLIIEKHLQGKIEINPTTKGSKSTVKLSKAWRKEVEE